MKNFTEMICTEYDQELKSIHHFELHPELLPYVGPHYNDLRILLIGESHYIDGIPDQNIFLEWYNKSTREIFSGKDQEYQSWFNTREIATNFLCHRRSTATTEMFSYPGKLIKEILSGSGEGCPTDSAAFQCVAFFNFYQRPNLTRGGSFCPITKMEESEISQAKEITKEIIEILKPSIVVFLSKKAYTAFGQEKIENTTIESTNHPTCSWWYKENGKDHFKNVIQKTIQENHLSQNLLDERIILMRTLFNDFANALQNNGFEITDYPENDIELYYNENSTKIYPKLIFHEKHSNLRITIDHKIFVHFPVGKWEYLSWYITEKPSKKNTPDFKNINDENMNYGRLYSDSQRKQYVDNCVTYIIDELNRRKK